MAFVDAALDAFEAELGDVFNFVAVAVELKLLYAVFALDGVQEVLDIEGAHFD